VFFFCKEKKRDPKQEEISQRTQFKDLFRVVKENKPLRTSVIALLIYYAGSSMMIGFGVTYFYLVYGYGGGKGGTIMTIFTVTYVFGTLISQFLFGALSKRFKKQTLLTWSCFITVAGYAAMFLIGIPLFGNNPLAYNSNTDASGLAYALGGTVWLLYLPPLVFFAGEGIFYLVLLLMMQNSIEYNEWAFGNRRESVIFSWRPLDAKFGSAIQKGVIYLTLLASGLFTAVIHDLSGAETSMAESISAHPDHSVFYQLYCSIQIDGLISSVQRTQKISLGIGMIGSVVVSVLLAWAICHWGYKLDEDDYTRIVKELQMRHAQDDKEKDGAPLLEGVPSETPLSPAPDSGPK
jgi:melibiose permease/lactose/raffinose/galactose permease